MCSAAGSVSAYDRPRFSWPGSRRCWFCLNSRSRTIGLGSSPMRKGPNLLLVGRFTRLVEGVGRTCGRPRA
eukprot:3447555-Alexandrium_andersonii.AAC.1